MAKKLTTTPRYKVRSALRALWLRSRERSQALKRSNYCCESCGVKQSKRKGYEVKVEVHHAGGMDWERLIDMVYERLLCNPDKLAVFCPSCHDNAHGQGDSSS